jgi:threonine dehydratase
MRRRLLRRSARAVNMAGDTGKRHPPTMTVTVDDIRAAAKLIADEVLRTPCLRAKAISEASGADVAIKLESLQYTGSFKPRGALVKLLSLDGRQRQAGVVAASAGNHAQGVAFHARRLGIPATIFMPTGTPFNKVARTEALGAKVVLKGEGLGEAGQAARAMAEAEGRTFVHPYDDDRIIAGQGTVALEMLADHPDLDTIVVPIGGGGLIAGIAIAAKTIKPAIEIVGAEAALYPSMSQAIKGGTPTGGGPTIAEGIAVKIPGERTVPVVRALVSDIVLVDEPALESAVQTYLEAERLVVEGAGAASLAALMTRKERFRGRKVGLVVSGGNIDSRIVSSILMRGLVREGRLVRLRVGITDQPGVLAKIAGLIGDAGGNIIEVYHQRLFYDVPVKQADVDIVIETLDVGHVRAIIGKLEGAGFPTRLLGNVSSDA